MNRQELALTRCDRCGAATKFQVFIGEKHALNLCAHHHTQNQDALQQVDGVNILELVEVPDPEPVPA